MTDHPIHLAGRYFACHNPEQDWINDQRDQAEQPDAGEPSMDPAEDVFPTEGKASFGCSPHS